MPPGEGAAATRGDGLLLQWHVTERCNFRCAHCYQEEYAGDELGFDEQLEVVREFVELCRLLGGSVGHSPSKGHITVTGGEPFIQDTFWNLLEHLSAHPREFTFGILTNGSMIDAHAATRLKELGPWFVQVSIDGNRELNDQLRVPGAYDSAVSALRHLISNSLRTAVSFTAQRRNYKAFPSVVRLATELGVWRVWSDRLIPAGQGAEMAADMLTAEETREFFGIMQQARAESLRSFSRTDVSLARALQFLVGGGRPYHCAAGGRLITLQPNGDVYPCRRMPIAVGNIHEKSLSDIYFSAPQLQELRTRSEPSIGCEDCRHAKACGGGLRCLSYAVTGSPFNADPGCWHARPTASMEAQSQGSGKETHG